MCNAAGEKHGGSGIQTIDGAVENADMTVIRHIRQKNYKIESFKRVLKYIPM